MLPAREEGGGAGPEVVALGGEVGEGLEDEEERLRVRPPPLLLGAGLALREGERGGALQMAAAGRGEGGWVRVVARLCA